MKHGNGDRELLGRLAGKPYAQVDQELSTLANMADAPVAKLGEDWSFISQGEAWYLLAPYLASSDIETFRTIAIEILSRNSPQFDLPLQERYLAPIRGRGSSLQRQIAGGNNPNIGIDGHST